MICQNMDIRNSPKFTKGEKCIFLHLVFTFSLTLILVIIYLFHLYVIKHDLKEVFDTRKSLSAKQEHPVVEYLPIGILYLNQSSLRNICNTILLSWRWSVAPAHCLAIRSDPDLSHLLSAWKIRYTYNLDNAIKRSFTDKNIKRSFIHPHFDSDTFADNIGLLQHDSIQSLQEYRITNSNKMVPDEIYVASWNDKGYNDNTNLETYSVKVIDGNKCMLLLTPVLELRNYEFCINLQDEISRPLEWGAAIINLRDKEFIGFFSWGEREPQVLPTVTLNITHYTKWLDTFLL